MFFVLWLAGPVLAQGQAITLHATDMPLPGTFNCLDLSSFGSPPAPVVSSGGLWDYSPYWCAAYFSYVYNAETDTFFTGAGINVNHPTFKTLGTVVSYNVVSELKADATGVAEAALQVPSQGFDLSGCTTTPTDSILFPLQSALCTTQKEIIHYPLTMSSAWSSTSRRVANFVLTIAADSLNHVAGQHIYTVHRSDSVVGWGSARVSVGTGASILYPVLIDRMSEYTQDSLYLNGVPAPDTVLTTLGVVQGARTSKINEYNFYRSGEFNALLSFYYGSDSTFTTPTDVSLDTDNLEPLPTGIASQNTAPVTSVIYPNPVIGTDIHVILTDNKTTPARYVVSDKNGKTVVTGAVNNQGIQTSIHLPTALAPGTYQMNLFDDDGGMMLSEQIVVQ